MLKDKYRMSIEENVFYAKRNIVDSIYKSAKLEGIAVTFPETYEIYEGRNIAHLSVDDVVKINNLKYAWQFIFDTIDYPADLRYIKQMNQKIEQNLIPLSGKLRTADVSIGGTTWKPEIPYEEKVQEELSDIFKIEAATERAITLMLYIMRSQLFYDGNKRTAQLVANQLMIQNGCGIIAIPVEKQKDFFELLIKYYETNDNRACKEFIYNYALDGYNRVQEKTILPKKETQKTNNKNSKKKGSYER